MPALVIGGLAYACWYFMKKVTELQEARVADAKEFLADAAKREAETITALNLINAAMNSMMNRNNGGVQR